MIDKLKKCGFEKITDETNAVSYIDNEYQKENITTFSYITLDGFIILDLKSDDEVLRSIDGSSTFLLRYNGELYQNTWNEGVYEISFEEEILYLREEFEFFEGEKTFDDFIIEIKSKGIKIFYVDNL